MVDKRPALWRLEVGLLVFPLGLMAVGCGSSQGTISGKVSYQGKVVPGGTVSILPGSGGALTGEIKEDGTYTIKKVPAGPAKVTVETDSVKPVSSAAPPQARGAAAYYAKMPKPPEGVGKEGQTVGPALSGGDAKRYVPIPANYSDPEKSGLSLTVKGGNNPFDIDLK